MYRYTLARGCIQAEHTTRVTRKNLLDNLMLPCHSHQTMAEQWLTSSTRGRIIQGHHSVDDDEDNIMLFFIFHVFSDHALHVARDFLCPLQQENLGERAGQGGTKKNAYYSTHPCLHSTPPIYSIDRHPYTASHTRYSITEQRTNKSAARTAGRAIRRACHFCTKHAPPSPFSFSSSSSSVLLGGWMA